MFPCREMTATRIPAGEYFLLADNRAESEDSRLWSPRTIPKSALLGKVIKVLMPSTAVQALGADSPVSGLYWKLRGRPPQAQRSVASPSRKGPERRGEESS